MGKHSLTAADKILIPWEPRAVAPTQEVLRARARFLAALYSTTTTIEQAAALRMRGRRGSQVREGSEALQLALAAMIKGGVR